jgi:hypothetical protein
MSRKLALVMTSALTTFVAITGLALFRPSDNLPGPTPAGETGAAPASPRLAEGRAQPATSPQMVVPAPASPAANRAAAQAQVSRDKPAQVSRDEAAQIAAAALGGGRIRSVQLEREHGRAVYEVKVGRAEVYVDAASGEVFPEHDDEDEDEDDDD